MQPAQQLSPGDRVIDLTTIARNAGLCAGGLTALLVTRLAIGDLGRTLAFGLVGAIVGGMVGHIMGRIRYTTDGRHHVVKLGPTALKTLVTTGLSTSIPVAIVVWLACLTIIGGPAPSLETGAACLTSGVLSGLVIGRIASRL